MSSQSSQEQPGAARSSEEQKFVELTFIFVVPMSAEKTLVDYRRKMNMLLPATPYINVDLLNPIATELR